MGDRQSRWRRVIGLLLVAYGLAGLLIMAGGGLLVASSVARLDGLAGALETQRQALIRSMDATATFLRDAATGTGNVEASLGSAVDSARQTATLTRSLATAMDQLGAASAITIFGNQPFAGLGATLAGVSRQAAGLSQSLGHTADALAVNGGDLQHVHDDLITIGAQIDELRSEVAGAAVGAADLQTATHALDVSRIVLFGLLGWLGGQAVIAIAVGLALAGWRTQAAGERDAPGTGPAP
jgi:hypothetical protein